MPGVITSGLQITEQPAARAAETFLAAKINGKFHGLWKGFNDNGQLSWIGNYKNNKLEGPWESFYANGRQLRSRKNYINGKLHGLWELYHKNGQLHLKTNYNNGKREGFVEEFSENGQLRSRRIS